MIDDEVLIKSFRRTVNQKLKESVVKLIEEGESENTKVKLFSGDINLVKEVLADPSIDVNVTDYYGETPLFRAIYQDNLELAQLLVEHGADVNIKSNNGETILYLSCLNYANLSTIDWLLEHGADPNITDKDGKTALDILLDEGAFEHVYDIIESLVFHGAIVHDANRLLTGSCISDKLDLAVKALELGADINNTEWEGDTPLIFASREGHLDIIDMLLDKGADVNATSIAGFTPLACACISSNLNVIKILVEHGADVNAVTNDGASILSLTHNDEIKDYLIQRGAVEKE